MNYRGLIYNYYTTAFTNVKLFDTFTFQEVEQLYIENQKQIIDTGKFTVEETLNKDKFEKEDIGNKYYYKKGCLYSKADPGASFKPCLTSKTVNKDTYYNGKVAFLSIPREIIDQYQTGCLHNSDLTIVRQFVREVEDTIGWDGNWEVLFKEYLNMYGVESMEDFSSVWYIGMKKEGMMHPPFLFDCKFLGRGTHRSYLGALAGNDYAFFHTFKEDKFTIVSVVTRSKKKYFNNDNIRLEVDLKNKRIDYYLDKSNKYIGKLKV